MSVTSHLPQILPPVRTEIEITHGEKDNQLPVWILYDPVHEEYYQIGESEYLILKHWKAGITPEALIESIPSKYISKRNVEEFYQNLLHFDLLDLPNKKQKSPIKPNLLTSLLHHYLFFKIPLVHPDAFLSKTSKSVKEIFSIKVAKLMLILGLLSLFFIGQQWEEYKATLLSFANFKGLILFAITIPFCKIIHELGHAYMTKLQGLKVPTIGIAFLVLYPVLYTDTSESLKISAHKRLLIAIAGVWLELYLAILATWLWLFLPDGTLRNVMFFISSTSWLVSLLINISPFMKFDGYYVLSSFLGVRNLQPRSFATAKQWLRAKILGIETKALEKLTRRQHRIFLAYALTTWIYRLFIYIGIAFLVYHLFFKLLGMVLFLVEFYVFILGPIAKELKSWYELRSQLRWNKNTITSLNIFVIALYLFLTPWSHTLKIPATLSHTVHHLYSPDTAQISHVDVKISDHVKQGQALITLNSPELDYQKSLIEKELIGIDEQRIHFNPEQKSLGQEEVLLREAGRLHQAMDQLNLKSEALVLKAPFDGIVNQIPSELASGTWLNKHKLLITLVNPNQMNLEAFVPYSHIDRIQIGQQGKFIPNNLKEPIISVQISKIDRSNIADLSINHQSQEIDYLADALYPDTPAYHASLLGGDIAVKKNEQGRMVANESHYRIELQSTQGVVPLETVERGKLKLKIENDSYFISVWKKFGAVLVQESEF